MNSLLHVATGSERDPGGPRLWLETEATGELWAGTGMCRVSGWVVSLSVCLGGLVSLVQDLVMLGLRVSAREALWLWDAGTATVCVSFPV